MNKETEQWIEENNPYIEQANKDLNNLYINGKDFGWQEGAKAMAEHLEQQQNELWEKWRADEIIEAGLKELKNQPPTKKQIIGVLKYVYYEIFPEYDITPQGFDILVEDILNKWDYDD